MNKKKSSLISCKYFPNQRKHPNSDKQQENQIKKSSPENVSKTISCCAYLSHVLFLFRVALWNQNI